MALPKGGGKQRLPFSKNIGNVKDNSMINCPSNFSSISCGSNSECSTTNLNTSHKKKFKKLIIFCNGDKYYSGQNYLFCSDKIPDLNSLLNDLNRFIGITASLPTGVRYLFSLANEAKITSLDQIYMEERYVCSSHDNYIKLNYDKNCTPSWNSDTKFVDSALTNKSEGHVLGAFDTKEYIYPKLITIFRNGPEPREMIKLVLNKKTAHSFEQVLEDIAKKMSMHNAVRKLFSMKGKQIKKLEDFFQKENVFIACGLEKLEKKHFNLENRKFKKIHTQLPIEDNTNSLPSSSNLAKSTSFIICTGEKPLFKSYDENLNILTITPYCKQISPIENNHAEIQSLPAQILAKYNVGKIIGDGHFAIVRECMDIQFSNKYALKIIDEKKCVGRENLIASEIAIMSKIKHPNIVEFIEYFSFGKRKFLIMELMEGGDLFEAISASRKYSEKNASKMMHDLAKALTYLHTLNIAHRDVKPENLLVVKTAEEILSLKLGDFGLAIEVEEPLYTICGSHTYVAPEVLSEIGYGLKVDVWASGVIAFILLCGYPPFSSKTKNDDEMFCQILEGSYTFESPYWDSISVLAKDFISEMLIVDSDERLSAAEMLNHKWLDFDSVPDLDLHSTVSKKMNQNFERKYTSQTAAITLITQTTLDKVSSKFQFNHFSGDNQQI